MCNYLTGTDKSNKYDESLLLGDYCQAYSGGERMERDQRDMINEFSTL